MTADDGNDNDDGDDDGDTNDGKIIRVISKKKYK